MSQSGRTVNFTPDRHGSEAKRLLRSGGRGTGPCGHREAGKDRPLLGRCSINSSTDHADAKLRASTAGEYRRLARLYVPSALRRKTVAEVSRADIARLHLAMKEKPYQANRTLALLSKFFNWCEKHGYRIDGSNPCRHIGKYRERRHERFLSANELAALAEASLKRKIRERRHRSSLARSACWRSLAPGSRRSSHSAGKRRHRKCLSATVGLQDRPKVDLPERAGTRGPQHHCRDWRAIRHVIAGERVGAHLVNLQKPWRRIRRAAGLEDVRIHDFRHGFASVAAASGQSLYVIGSLLGHSPAADHLTLCSPVGGPVAGSERCRWQSNRISDEGINFEVARVRIPFRWHQGDRASRETSSSSALAIHSASQLRYRS